MKISWKLSSYAWKLKDRKQEFNISWKILARANSFSAITNVCNLCVMEKYQILYFPELGTLNQRTELTSNCRHKSSMLLDKG